jgi:hypothetical protein
LNNLLGRKEGAAVVDDSRNLRNITAAAARIFGLDTDKPAVQLNHGNPVETGNMTTTIWRKHRVVTD